MKGNYGAGCAVSAISTSAGYFKRWRGDGFFTQGTGFYNDPQPQCLQRQDYFSVTRRGLTIWFLSPRDTLTFSIEERLLSAEQGKLIRFVAPTCRLSVRVIKEIKIDEAWVPLEPAE